MVFKQILLLAGICLALTSFGQVVTECPQNIGFERGDFRNWECYTGEISSTMDQNAPRPAVITVAESPPVKGIHTLIPRGNKDFYGDFSLNAPNGSDYVVKLGNEINGRGAESISYTLDVPAGVEAYSIIFSYAVVLENPDHAADEQPKFTAKVIDLTTNTLTDCGSFEFVAPGKNGGIPGFETSKKSDDVLYKSWSPVMVNLSDYLGHKVRLEFTTNDCSRGRHFGYAYIDFNENCSVPVIGNITCPEAKAVTLQVLPGFAGYRWYYTATGEVLGTKEAVTLSPVPPVGTGISVELKPYQGLGCTQTLHTAITDMYMNIGTPAPSCKPVDLTATYLTVGNSSDLSYTYWQDSQTTIPLPNPRQVTSSGTYFVKGTSSSGCTLTAPVNVTIIKLPPVMVTPPEPRIYPATADITTTFPHEPGLTYSYWADPAATMPLTSPSRIRLGGTYYIKALNSEGCFLIEPVKVEIIIPDIIAPNTFTPNGDGVNDVFTILLNSVIKVKSFRIFNRWGEIVYQTTDINNYWNGLKENTRVPVGVYYWVLDGDEGSKRYSRSGYVMVAR